MKNQQIDKVSNKDWLTDSEQRALIDVIEQSFTGVDADVYFAKYFASSSHFQRCVRLFYQENSLVGYCLLTFSYGEERSIIMGASAAFLPSYRGNNNTFSFSFLWALKTYLMRPSYTLYYLDTMLSPAMYRAMGKKLAYIFPNPTMTQDQINHYQALVKDAEKSPWRELACLKTVGRSTNYSGSELACLKASRKAEIAFYHLVNPDFANGRALLVLIPINIKQLLLTGIKWLKQRLFR